MERLGAVDDEIMEPGRFSAVEERSFALHIGFFTT